MAKTKKHIVMIAAENGALVGGKAGGVADVIRDLPRALAAKGCKVTVVTPSYGFLHTSNPVLAESEVEFPFCDRPEAAQVFTVRAETPTKGVEHVVIENVWIRGNPIYTHDEGYRPFASDASKYAMFCSAVGRLALEPGSPIAGADVIHLHDWHTGTFLVLRDIHPAFEGLKAIRTVYTIHNLGIQGTRPLEGDESSLAAWFPELFLDPATSPRIYGALMDARYRPTCYTPMMAGILLADVVTTVSPSYAEEILRPSDYGAGFWGGEGLDALLRSAAEQGRLHGVLNGIEYPEERKAPRLAFAKLRDALEKSASAWLETQPDHHGHRQTLARLESWKGKKVKVVATAVSRMADQKVRLYLDRGPDGISGFDRVMERVNEAGGVFVFLGEGAIDFVRPFYWAMEHHENFVFLERHDADVADLLYASGHLFLMPSLYEPCGIAQMLAMRDGQPPVVHATGGLRDTVIDNVNGFAFDGANIAEKVEAFGDAVGRALAVFAKKKKAWGEIRTAATEARHGWDDAAKSYLQDVY
ncbi:MAG: glycogen/starch synthase [Deltaproteobacteria bacterium]|nr:glycogen/starch synthase [Deltaproteobacteria bacterium]